MSNDSIFFENDQEKITELHLAIRDAHAILNDRLDDEIACEQARTILRNVFENFVQNKKYASKPVEAVGSPGHPLDYQVIPA